MMNLAVTWLIIHSNKKRGGDTKNNISELRRKNNLTQRELARITNLSERNLQAIEAGKLDPRTSNSIKIARALSTTVEALYEIQIA